MLLMLALSTLISPITFTDDLQQHTARSTTVILTRCFSVLLILLIFENF